MWVLLAILLVVAGALGLVADLGSGVDSPAVLVVVIGLILAVIASHPKFKKPSQMLSKGSLERKKSFNILSIVCLGTVLFGLADLRFSIVTEGLNGLIWIYLLPIFAILAIGFAIASSSMK